MRTSCMKMPSRLLAGLSALSLLAQAPLAMAQGAPPPAPPAGQYAPPPGGGNGSSTYDPKSQEADRAYAAQYSAWAAKYCVDQHNKNVAAGAIIGGVLGATLGAAAGKGAGAAVGGVLGAGTGAVVGSTASPSACPPGYVVSPGAPAFAYTGPYYDPALVYAPDWYSPWVWIDGRWVYHPYRYWYWYHPVHWQPGWRAGPWHYHYRRW